MDERIIDVSCNKGQKRNCPIQLSDVFCDGYKKDKPIGVFSHFHQDHIAAVTECIGSCDVLITHPITFKGITALQSGIQYRQQWTPQNFGTKYVTQTGYVELLKANHIPGASQVYVDSDGKSLLYSGDFSFPDVQIKQADYLVIDATHGDYLHDGKTDRKSVKNRMFDDIMEKTNAGKSVVIQTSSGTLQELVRHFEMGYKSKLGDDVMFVMEKKQKNVLECIYEDEFNEFRDILEYDSKEYWSLMRNKQKAVIFTTSLILTDELKEVYRIIVGQYRFDSSDLPIIPNNGFCRYNLGTHASIREIYSYVEGVNPTHVITDSSRSKYAPRLAKLLSQKFPSIKTSIPRPPPQ